MEMRGSSIRNSAAISLRRPMFSSLAAGVILYRLILPVRAGQFGPDESLFALRAQSILSRASLPPVGLSGNYGMVYGPYPSYYFAVLYGLTQFNLGWALLISSIVLVTAPFLLAASIKEEGYPQWTFLLALTSPLAIYFSVMGLWDTPLLIPLSAFVLYFTRFVSKNTAWKEFVIGLLLGVSVGSHLLAITFVAGISAWRVLVTKRTKSIIGLGAGILIAVMPYAIGLWQVRSELSPSLRRAGGETIIPGPVALLASLLRFWGAHPGVRINPNGWLLAAEDTLSQVTVSLAIVLLLVAVYHFWKSRRKQLSIENPLAAFALCAVFYLPFAYITNTSIQPQYGQALWWFAPLVIPAIVMGIMPKRAGVWCLSLLVALNLMITAVEYTPRIVNGTQASYAYGHGPSWWAYEEVASTLCAEANNQWPGQGMVTAEMSGEPSNMRIRFILENLIKLKHSDCAQRVQLIWSDTSTGRVLRVEPDPDRIHLRVFWVTR